MKISLLRGGVAAISLIALAACSTAGAQYAPGTGTAGPFNTHLASPFNAVATPAPPTIAQRALAAAAVAVAGSGADLYQYGSNDGQVARMVRFGRTIANRHVRSPHVAAPTCKNGVEFEYQSNGQGQVSEFLEYFYDAACAHPFSEFELNTDYTSAGGSGVAELTTFAYGGSTTSYQMDSIAFTYASGGGLANIAVQKTRNFGASTYSKGFACLFGTGNAVDCGGAVAYSFAPAPALSHAGAHPSAVVTPPPSPSPSPSASPTAAPAVGEIGISHGELGQYTYGNSAASRGSNANPFDTWPSGVQIQIAANGYTGAAGSLAIAQDALPAWEIDYGTQADTLTGTATVGYGGYWWGNGAWHDGSSHARLAVKPHWITSAALTLTDAANGLTVALASNGRGELTGNITQTSNGESVAQVTLDFFGTGYVLYPNGTYDVIANWTLVN